MKTHPDIAEKAAQEKKKAEDAMNKLRNDKEMNIIFARRDYQLRDGITLGLDREKSYLYLSADDAFLNDAEAKLKKSIASIERAPPDIETQLIETIEEEKQKTDEGLGFIFR